MLGFLEIYYTSIWKWVSFCSTHCNSLIHPRTRALRINTERWENYTIYICLVLSKTGCMCISYSYILLHPLPKYFSVQQNTRVDYTLTRTLDDECICHMLLVRVTVNQFHSPTRVRAVYRGSCLFFWLHMCGKVIIIPRRQFGKTGGEPTANEKSFCTRNILKKIVLTLL